MDINEKVNAVLGAVYEHYYSGMPEFAGNEEPDTYAVYFVREKPDNFASGIYLAKAYWVSVSIISGSYDRGLYRQTEKAFANEGFIYSGGSDNGSFETSGAYPHRYMFTQEYLKTEDTEEN